MPQDKGEKVYTYVQKVWIAGGILALIAILMLLFEATFNVLILIFAGALIASYFRGISQYLQKKTGWKSWITLTISTVGTLLLVTGLFWLIGATVSTQAAELENTLPSIVKDVEAALRNSAVGKELVGEIEDMRNSGEMTSYISRFFATTFGFIGDFYIILIIGIFFTASPQLYKNGITQMVPPRGRKRAEEVQKKLATGLKMWLGGKFIAMLAVFVLTAIGLAIIGIPMWLTLSLMAGLLNFVPNFGPLAAMIPAVLVGLSINPATALTIAILYIAIQLLESSIINPQAQKKLIKIPPALIIISQLLIGALSGIWGVILATPIVLMIIILVQELYVKRMDEKEREGNSISGSHSEKRV